MEKYGHIFFEESANSVCPRAQGQLLKNGKHGQISRFQQI
jgi:hypothetical protein